MRAFQSGPTVHLMGNPAVALLVRWQINFSCASRWLAIQLYPFMVCGHIKTVCIIHAWIFKLHGKFYAQNWQGNGLHAIDDRCQVGGLYLIDVTFLRTALLHIAFSQLQWKVDTCHNTTHTKIYCCCDFVPSKYLKSVAKIVGPGDRIHVSCKSSEFLTQNDRSSVRVLNCFVSQDHHFTMELLLLYT